MAFLALGLKKANALLGQIDIALELFDGSGSGCPKDETNGSSSTLTVNGRPASAYDTDAGKLGGTRPMRMRPTASD